VIGFLRFVGLTNAAVWFGAVVFFTCVGGPAFFSPEMKRLLPSPYNGAAAELVIARFFWLQHVCGAVGLLHLLAEWLYTGRPVARVSLWLVGILFGLGLLGGFVLQPYLHEKHAIKYAPNYRIQATTQQREQAARAFGVVHGVSQAANLLMILGLWAYLWQVAHPANTPRFVSSSKFRG
jgi:hypothetical protein